MAEHPVFRSPAAGEQKQGHVDSELLLEQGDDPRGLAQSTVTDRPTETLARLFTQRHKQFVEPVFLQGLNRRDPADLIKAEIEATQAGPQGLRQVWHQDLITEMTTEVMQCVAHHLQGAAAALGC